MIEVCYIIFNIEEVSDWINTAQNPIILAGVEVARLGLGKELMKFAERNDIPVATKSSSGWPKDLNLREVYSEDPEVFEDHEYEEPVNLVK